MSESVALSAWRCPKRALAGFAYRSIVSMLLRFVAWCRGVARFSASQRQLAQGLLGAVVALAHRVPLARGPARLSAQRASLRADRVVRGAAASPTELPGRWRYGRWRCGAVLGHAARSFEGRAARRRRVRQHGRDGVRRARADWETVRWASDPLLRGDTSGPCASGAEFPIGANGIVLSGGAVFTVNTDMGSMLRIPVQRDGSAGPVSTFVASPALLEGSAGSTLFVTNAALKSARTPGATPRPGLLRLSLR